MHALCSCLSRVELLLDPKAFSNMQPACTRQLAKHTQYACTSFKKALSIPKCFTLGPIGMKQCQFDIDCFVLLKIWLYLFLNMSAELLPGTSTAIFPPSVDMLLCTV